MGVSVSASGVFCMFAVFTHNPLTHSPCPLTSVEARARLLSLVQMSAVNPASDDSQSNLQLTFDQKVSVVLGDLSQPLLGLKEDTFYSLSKSVDIIIHNGARVNHVLPYTGKLPTTVFSVVHL